MLKPEGILGTPEFVGRWSEVMVARGTLVVWLASEVLGLLGNLEDCALPWSLANSSAICFSLTSLKNTRLRERNTFHKILYSVIPLMPILKRIKQCHMLFINVYAYIYIYTYHL